MRITGFHVGGFGLLSDLQVTGLAPGTTVVCGPNEAGKSTLHAFLVRTMFGHPRANDARGRNRHEPLRGGRHGGVLLAEDGDGDAWEIHRYTTGTPVLRVVAPDGTESTTGDALADLVGRGMDEDRYEQVFAIDLDALASLGSLKGEALDELLLDAATVGAGRSLRRAIADLQARRDELWTPRSKKPPLNAALAERRDAEKRLRDAQERAGSYRQAQDQVAHLAGELERVRADQARVSAEVGRRRRLVAAWPAWQDLTGAEQRLSEGRDATPPTELVDVADDVARHASRRPLQDERRERLARATDDLAAAEQAVQVAMNGLPPTGWDADRVLAMPTDPGLLTAVQQAVDDLRAAQQELAASEREVAAAEQTLTTARKVLAQTRDGVGPQPAQDVDARRAAVSALRGLLPKLDPAASRAARPATPTWVPVLAVVLTLVLLASSLAAFTINAIGIGVATLVGAVLSGGVAVGTWRSAAGRSTASPAPTSTVPDLEHQVITAGQTLGLTPPITLEQAEAADLETHRMVEQQRDWENQQAAAQREEQAVTAAEDTLHQLRERHQDLQRTVDDALTSWRTAADRAGLDPDMDPGTAPALLTRVHEAQRALQAIMQARTAHADLDQRVRDFDRATADLCAAAGREVGDDLDAALDRLAADCAAESEARQSHDRGLQKAEEDWQQAQKVLHSQLGDDQEAEALRTELATGRVTAWENELAELERQAAQLEDERDDLVRQHTTAEQELRAIGQDDAVVTAASEVELLTARCQELAEEWATADLAARLLATTLERFEEAHQPAVLEEAGALLAQATAGRWTSVRRIDDELYVAADGDPVPAHALSRGATEQLYLCLRLALAEELNQHGARLPLLIDDLMANADPERADGLARILADVGTRQQVIVFTCNPATADRVVAADPAACVLAMQPAGGGASWQRQPGARDTGVGQAGGDEPASDGRNRGSGQLELDGTGS